MEHDRRIYQRLHLTSPLVGRFRQTPVRLIDVSATGALIEHDERLPTTGSDVLEFSWRGEPVRLGAEIVRSSAHETGLRFVEESAQLQRFIARSAEEVLRAQQANMAGEREANIIGDETLTSASAGLRGTGYTVWSFSGEGWTKRRALLPDQPDDGFTVSAAEPVDQVELLKRTWESGNEEARRMTRLLAELSAASVRMKS